MTNRTVRSCGLGLAAAVLTLLCCAGGARAATTTTGAAAPTPVPLTLTTTRPLGYVDAVIGGGSPGERVTLAEHAGGAVHTIATVTLGSHGATVRHAISWACAPLVRTLAATPADGGAAVTTTVSTPSCAHRLAVTFPGAARVGQKVGVAVRDRWDLGDNAVSLCLTAPGGPSSCTDHVVLASRGVVHVTLPRVGGWAFTLRQIDGVPHRALVWAEHPGGQITLLAAGDSEMQVLDNDLKADLAPYHVTVREDAQPSTGLTAPLLNWQGQAAHDVGVAHPDVSVVSMGANDGFPIGATGCCGAPWATAYGARVAQMARTLLQGQTGRVYWFELAAPKPGPFPSVFDGVNGGIMQAARTLAGRLGLINANAYFTPGNRYRNYMVINGHGFTIHESDGVHLDATADVYAARLVVHQLLADHVIRPLSPGARR